MPKMPEPPVDLPPPNPVIGLDELWLRCFGLGTMHTASEVEALLRGEARPSRHEYNVIAVALNEYCLECGATQLLPYVEDEALITTRSLRSAAALVPHQSPTLVPCV